MPEYGADLKSKRLAPFIGGEPAAEKGSYFNEKKKFLCQKALFAFDDVMIPS